MRIDMKEVGNSPILAGAEQGKAALGRMISKTKEPAQPELCILDFDNVEVATASHLRESVFAFRDRVRRRRSNIYPVLANMNDIVRDEIVELVRLRADVVVACKHMTDGTISAAELIGELEPKQRLTLDLVRELGKADVAALMRDNEQDAKPTAWNNRLAALAVRGILVEFTSGRSKQYKPVLEGI